MGRSRILVRMARRRWLGGLLGIIMGRSRVVVVSAWDHLAGYLYLELEGI